VSSIGDILLRDRRSRRWESSLWRSRFSLLLALAFGFGGELVLTYASASRTT